MRKKISTFKKVQYVQHYVSRWGDDFSGRMSIISKMDLFHFKIGAIYTHEHSIDIGRSTTSLNGVVVGIDQIRGVIEYNHINELLYPELEKTLINDGYWLVSKLPRLFFMADEDYTEEIKKRASKHNLDNMD